MNEIPLIPEGSALLPDGRPNFQHIRRVYESLSPLIMESERWIDTHFIEWTSVFTPIELNMWSLIRSQSVPFYPQYPVGRFFVDFGCPHRRIAIECDGKRWHDPERDLARDVEILERHGWVVVRFSGRACYLLDRLPREVFTRAPLQPVDSFEVTIEEMVEKFALEVEEE